MVVITPAVAGVRGEKIRAQTRGYLLVVFTATLWGISGNLAKYLMQDGVSPLILTQARSLISALVLLVFLLATGRAALRLTRSTAAWTMFFGLSLALTQVCYFSAIERLNVAAAILLEYLAPAMVVMYGWLFLGRGLTRVTIVSLMGVMVGSALVVEAYDPEALSLSAAGVAFGVAAAIAFSTYILVGEHLQKLGKGVATQLFYGFSLTALMLAALRPPWAEPAETYDPGTLLLLVLVGIGGTLVPFACFFISLRHIDSGSATIVSTLEPVVAGVVAFFWFGETFGGLQILGAAIVIGAIVALQQSDTGPPEAIVPPEVIAFPEPDA
jgi:drug/metabolite transporter (DMT)-like permease